MRRRSLRAALLALVAIALSIPAEAGHSPQAPVISLDPKCGPSTDQPNLAPSVVQTSPPDDALVNFATAAGRTFSWEFSDPNPGDSQSAFAFRRIVEEGDYFWWNVATSSWTSTEVFNSGATATITFPSGSWQNTIEYRWTVAVKDSSEVTSPYAAEFIVTGDAPPNAPTLTQPDDEAFLDWNSADERVFKWQFSDPDVGDTQSAWAFRRQRVTDPPTAQPVLYYNASASEFQDTEVFNPGGDQEVAFPINSWTQGEEYDWSVRTKDSFDLQGPYAANRNVFIQSGVFGPESAEANQPESASGETSPSAPSSRPMQEPVAPVGAVAASSSTVAGAAALGSVQVPTYDITVSGSNFLPGTVRIRFGVGSGIEQAFSVSVDASGDFSRVITPTQRATGIYIVRAQDGSQAHVAEARFFVPCPTLTVTPKVVRRGFVVFASATGYPANTEVLLDWRSGIGAARTLTDASGVFRIGMLVFPKDILGPRVLSVSIPSVPDFPEQRASVLVVPGPVMPKGFVNRR